MFFFLFITIIFTNTIRQLFFFFFTDKLQTRCGFPDYQIWLHSPVRFGDRHLHLHEPHQRRDHLCYCPARGHLRHHWGQQEGSGKNVRISLVVKSDGLDDASKYSFSVPQLPSATPFSVNLTQVSECKQAQLQPQLLECVITPTTTTASLFVCHYQASSGFARGRYK